MNQLAVPNLKAIFNTTRNGCNGYIRHPLARKLVFTDGVKQVADEAGAWWLLDVLGTEATPALLKAFKEDGATLGIIKLKSADKKCAISMTTEDDEPPIWGRRIAYTTFPEGEWTLFMGVDQVLIPGSTVTVLMLPSEY
jgi:hypothetical protein